MNLFITRIGAISLKNKVNKVKLERGLNIITGNSQTGKSALIKIVDYCLLSSKNVIPLGKIQDNIEIFYIILEKNNKKIILGRESYYGKRGENGRGRAFLKMENIEFDEDIIEKKYFENNKEYFKTLEELKVNFLDIFNINSIERINEKGELQRPTHRNIMSFIIQGQNTIADNQILFERTNDSMKKKSIIVELPILLGLVDQEYNLKRLEKESVEKQLRRLTLRLEYEKDERNEIEKEIKILEEELEEYNNLEEGLIIADKKIRKEVIYEKNQLEKKINEVTIKLFEVENRLSEIDKVQFEKLKIADKVKKRSDLEFKIIKACPFCNSKVENLNKEIEYLQKIKEEFKTFISRESNLNSTLLKNKSLLENEEKELTKILKKLQKDYKELEEILNASEKTNERLIERLIYKKLKLNSLVKRKEEIILNETRDEYQKLNENLIQLSEYLKNVNIDEHLKRINVEIAQEMEEIIKKLDYEKSLGDPQININIEKLEYYQLKDNKRFYLYSMGSASNWLAIHLSMFLALNYIFSKYSSKVSIPSILFLDQPSQVYFPSKDNKRQSIDYENVENIFKQILNYIDKTEERTGIKPQIIILEHADNLNLGENYNFEDYVRARWNNGEDGFIKN